jgi:hypothetical protein
MKISLTQISISDRVNAAKTSPNATDTSSIPTSMNPSPGDSTIAPIDATGINKAGKDVNGKTQEGNRATTDSARKGQSQEASQIQYENQQVNPEEQAPTASTKEELANTPQPKSKGFKESLIDSQMASMMGDKTGGDRGKVDSDFGHDNGDPNEYVKPQPNSQPIRRDKMDPYNNSNNRVQEPSRFPITSFDKENNMEPYKAPDQNFGPTYKSKNLSAPKIAFKTPKINTPRF